MLKHRFFLEGSRAHLGADIRYRRVMTSIIVQIYPLLALNN